ncbi:MAG: hypothetical protein V4475_09025 [Pseudomonadota bacterium]
MATGRERKTIDGSLLVFLVICCVTSLAYIVNFGTGLLKVAAFERVYGPEPLHIVLWSDGLALLQITIPVLVVWRMVTDKRWATVRLAITLIWLLFIGLPLIDIVGAQLFYGMSRAHWLQSIVPQMSRGMFFAFLATLYLLRSKRVDNTYRHGEIAEVFD